MTEETVAQQVFACDAGGNGMVHLGNGQQVYNMEWFT